MSFDFAIAAINGPLHELDKDYDALGAARDLAMSHRQV
jgi:hypothetical protein